MAIRSVQSGTGRVRSPGRPVGSTGGGGGVVQPASNLLYHFNTTGADSSGNGYDINEEFEMSFNGTAKFGSGALYYNGGGVNRYKSRTFAGGYPALGANPFCIDFWCSTTVDITAQVHLIGTTIGVSRSYDFLLTTAEQMRLIWGGTTLTTTSSFTIGGAYAHIALTRDASNVMRLFFNGTQEASATVSGAPPNLGGDLKFGGTTSLDSGGGNCLALVDEFRMVLNNPVWTSDFTPPTSAYTQ